MDKFRIELMVWSTIFGERPPEGDSRWLKAYYCQTDNGGERCSFKAEDAALMGYDELDSLNLNNLAARCRNQLSMADFALGSVNIIRLREPEEIHINITIVNDDDKDF